MLEEGQLVGTFRLVRRLGAGAFGEVWLATHVALGVERALKVPTDPDYVSQLRKEGQLQFSLHHPNIVKTFDLNPLHEPPYAVMEYVEGESLRQRLDREGTLPQAEALRILRHVLEATQAAHAAGILHRGLKPENILLAADGAVKVTDFGISKVHADVAQSMVLRNTLITSTGASISGTHEYMSPEQRIGQDPVPGDDVYAVGVIACELFTGRRPRGARLDRVLDRAGVPAAIARIIDKACEERDYRYAAPAEMLADVAALAAEQPSPAPRPPPAARPSAPPVAAAPEALITNSIGMKLKRIPPGTFTMGCESDRAYSDEKPAHQVTLTKPFYLGICPVTQGEYERVIGSNPSHFKGPNRPVERISWDDAQTLCRKLSESEGVEYRLPTEAEWEYACRAGSTTESCFGDDEARLGDYAWFRGNSGRVEVTRKKRLLGLLGTREERAIVDQRTHDVGQKKPNAWGLHDVHGNVWEWCQDWFGDYQGAAQTDPTGPASGEIRVLRGGSWSFDPWSCRSSARDGDAPQVAYGSVGVRLARTRHGRNSAKGLVGARTPAESRPVPGPWGREHNRLAGAGSPWAKVTARHPPPCRSIRL